MWLAQKFIRHVPRDGAGFVCRDHELKKVISRSLPVTLPRLQITNGENYKTGLKQEIWLNGKYYSCKGCSEKRYLKKKKRNMFPHDWLGHVARALITNPY